MIVTIEGISSSGRDIVIRATDESVADWIVDLDIEPAEFYHGGQSGNCYEASLILLMHATRHKQFEAGQVRLCHGVANMLTGGRGVHAWVEFLHDGQWWVLDVSFVGAPIRVSTQEEFYKANEIKADCVDYYLPADVVKLVEAHGENAHCGPWKDPRDKSYTEILDCEFML